jgi:ribose transport system substrate-binding protein
MNIKRRNWSKEVAFIFATVCVLLGAGRQWAHADDIPADLSLKGKTIGITVVGTDHFWDLKAYQGQVAEVKRLGGTPIALDAGRKDSQQVTQIQTLITQKPDAIIEQLGNITVLEPWFKRIRAAGIPLFTVDTATPLSINDTTSNNWEMGEELAVQMVQDIGAKGNIIVFNGFYSVPVCAIRYDELKAVLRYYPDVKIIRPELRDVIPNTVQSAYSDVSDLLTKYSQKGSIAAIWACWGVPIEGAAQAVQATGRSEIKLYAGDSGPDDVKLVEASNSPVAAVIAQRPTEIGMTAVDNAARYLNGQKVPTFTFVPTTIVTKANVEDVKGKLGWGL